MQPIPEHDGGVQGRGGGAGEWGTGNGEFGNEKPGIGNEKPEFGNEKPKKVSVAKNGIEYREAKVRLDEQKGKDFSNSRTGISARLSSTGARKLISDAAVAKSVANGFTRRQHNEIAANVGALFEDASLVESRPDKAGDINIKSIKRFITPIEVDGKEAVAWITVKESTEHGHRIYSVEGIKIAALSPSMRRALADRNSADKAASGSSVPNNLPRVNAGEVSGKVLVVRGLGEGQLAKPGNWADGAVLVAELQRVAEKNGAVLDFGSVEANTEAAGLLNKVQTEGLERAKARLETRAKLFDVLARTALDTGVTFDEASFRKALAESSNGRRLVDNHGNIYGFTSPDGTLHFNPLALDYNIPIHEYGHLALESMKGVNRRLWERGMELVKGSDYYRSIKEQAETEGHEYSYLKGDEAGICDEALATMIGDNGEKLVEAQGVGAELKAWLKDFWKAFKGAFGLADLGEAQIEKMTLGEFADAVTAELLRGKEFGTRKEVPLEKKSITRYDEAEGSGSNGMLRWKNDRGRLFYIPVDMERTQPGGRVVLSTDDANITDWIKNRLNGYTLRMSKNGNIYVEGRNGLEGELAEIFGRYPKAGMNDGIGEDLASELHNDSLREATPDQLVEMLAKDRANYDEWVKATRDGKTSLEEARMEQHYAEEAEREEAEARRHWESSGMNVPEYILSRIEEGEPGFDLDWETMRELAHDEAEAKFAARRLINGQETAVSEGYPLSIREARDPDKVLKVLSPLVGKSAAQIGEMKLTRINAESMEHTLNSKEARHDLKDSSRKGKRLWRGRIGGLSVLDDIIATSPLGNAEKPNHFNRDWKKDAKFYRAETRFAVETEQGYEIYPCKLLVAELKNGERFVYDLVEVKEPTLSASAGKANLALPQGRTGESASSSRIVPNSDAGAQGGAAKFAVGGIFTGSSADYANRSREGGKDDGPSVKKIGTGEGSQVYGWGLYGSTERGVAEGYARPNHLTPEGLASSTLHQYSNDRDAAIAHLQKYVDSGRLSFRALTKEEIARTKGAIEILKSHAEKSGHLYEQTFFTNRAEGDESHLLKWYDEISDANWDRVIAQAEKEGLRDKLKGAWWLRFNGDLEHFITDNGNSGDAIYERLSKLLGTPQAASEFLARAGIDGVKYPVDSYGGKGVKDGDKVGWNYVSFRDDNIRVDHKWTDGQAKFAVAKKVTNANGDESYKVERNGQVKRYKTPKEALEDFIKELDGVEMDAEQRGIYDVATGTKKTTDIRKNDLGELVKLHKGGRGKGASKIIAVHYAGKRGKVTAKEVINMGLVIRNGNLTFDGNQDHPNARRYEATAADGARLRLIIDLDKQGNEAVINLYSDRKDGNPGHKASSGVETTSSSAEIIPNSGAGAQGGAAKFAVGGQVVGDFVIGRDGTVARRGTPQAAMIGGARVADDAGRGEQTPGSMAAALERLNQPRTTIRNVGQVRPMSLPLSEMEALRKMLTGDHLPATIAKKIARGGFAAHTKAGRLTIAASVFGLVDKTDVAPAKDRLKQHGFFRNEDEAWAASHWPAEVRAERERSERQLGDELLKIADRRARGSEAGGESAARGVYAHELAKIVMDMPRKEGGVIGRVQKIGDAVRANVKAILGERGTGNGWRKRRSAS